MVGHPRDRSSPSQARLLLETKITAGQLPAVRQKVEAIARQCGLTGERISDWVTAVHELMTNAVRHGGGAGQLRVWEDGRLICEVRDEGRGFSTADYVSPRNRPPLSVAGGMGLWIAQQMTDDLQIHSSPAGTIVRISTTVHGA
ncbi:ATP-binding protein [Micromonospora sp. DT47]|uniref:ATP-binding protein n=1 Tax=Micromonospora sp. DT47 TaxID=3393431 RepID=UPI003CE83801